MQFNRNGFLYVIDRTNGKLVAANPFEKVNWASHIDKETGRPVETELAKKLRKSETRSSCGPRRSAPRTGRTPPINPETGLLYANTQHQGALYKHLETKPLRGRPALHVHRAPADPEQRRRAVGPHRRGRSADRQAEVARAADRPSDLVGEPRRPAAACCSPARRPASSSRSTSRTASRSGSSRPAPASMPSRSPTPTTASSTSRCCPASAGCSGTSRATSSRTRCRRAARSGRLRSCPTERRIALIPLDVMAGLVPAMTRLAGKAHCRGTRTTADTATLAMHEREYHEVRERYRSTSN